jgi:hypothetical protein
LIDESCDIKIRGEKIEEGKGIYEKMPNQFFHPGDYDRGPGGHGHMESGRGTAYDVTISFQTHACAGFLTGESTGE